MSRWEGKSVLITGAAGGLGRALCLFFGKRGAHIHAVDIQESSLFSLKKELEAVAILVSIYPCDIGNNEEVEAVVREMESNHPVLDVVIHNAGISHRCEFQGMSPKVAERIMNVNVNGAIYMTHHTLPMVVRSKGTYVAISSVAGFSPLLGRTIYAASKHALHGFFDTLRAELEDEGVNVLMVCPSFIKTGLEKTAMQGDGKPVQHEKQFVGNVLSPEYVAECIYKGVAARKKRLYISPVAKLSLWLSRLSPSLYTRVMKRKMRLEIESARKGSRYI
ncbi:SDR family oxidoreductase [Salipaludibacillus sp. CUR1]|uniref:SDR family oxidoreductase n=1 Tax=Salipaludibacillus sp. CUR1 TaxID=2820003 RepID=UPI001E541F39|nr:SDR family oxidoreductase [Salipaludibacillus sp. CUR1]MCE7792853.1 SDR family oxidoreductase [Salipaludibacillus sp. CUR1]